MPGHPPRPAPRPSRTAVALLLLVVASAPAFAAEVAVNLTAEQVLAAGILTQPLTASGAGRITLTGRIETPENAPDPVLAPAQGRVAAVFAHPGDEVKAGAPLLALAGPEIARLQRDLQDSTTLAQSARQRAARDAQLHEEGIISKARHEQAQASARVADGQLESLRRMLGAARFEAGRLLLRAPRAGLVSGPAFGTGDAVATGELIAHIGPLQAPLVSLDAPVGIARSLRVGDALVVRSRGCKQAAVLHSIGRNVDPQTQTVTLHAELPAPSCLLPGEIIFAEATPATLSRQGFALPPEAFVRRAQSSFVFVQTAQGFVPTAVDAEAAAAGFAQAPGLNAGMRVAVQGTALLKAEWLRRGAD